MEYITLSGSDRDGLEQRVEAAFGEGWELVGGVAVVWDGKEKTYYQAIKRKI